MIQLHPSLPTSPPGTNRLNVDQWSIDFDHHRHHDAGGQQEVDGGDAVVGTPRTLQVVYAGLHAPEGAMASTPARGSGGSLHRVRYQHGRPGGRRGVVGISIEPCVGSKWIYIYILIIYIYIFNS